MSKDWRYGDVLKLTDRFLREVKGSDPDYRIMYIGASHGGDAFAGWTLSGNVNTMRSRLKAGLGWQCFERVDDE